MGFPGEPGAAQREPHVNRNQVSRLVVAVSGSQPPFWTPPCQPEPFGCQAGCPPGVKTRPNSKGEEREAERAGSLGCLNKGSHQGTLFPLLLPSAD